MLHTVYRDPFALGSPHISQVGEGFTLYQIVETNPHLPKEFIARGSVTLNGELVPREYWRSIKPKAGTIISMHDYIGGGEGGGGKQVFGLIAAIALTVVTGGISAGLLAPVLGASFAAGTIGAAVLSGVVGLAGALAISALTSPPTTKASEEAASSGSRLEAAAVDGNVLEANAPVPRVIGTRRTYPPFLTEPIIELIGQDEVVEAVWGLAGPHALEDIRLGDASIDLESDEAKDIEIEVRNGLAGDIPVTLTERQGRTTEPSVELSVHTVDPENQDTLDGADPLPVFHAVTTRISPDENWIHLNLAGLARQDATGDLRIPFRIRMRKRGDTVWRDLPEIHYQNETQNSVRLQIKIFWGSEFTEGFPPVPSAIGFVEARKLVPAQNVQPLGTEFTSDDYFSAGAGNDSLRTGTELTTNLRNVVLFAERVDIYLSSASWEPGIYDIEIKRGEVFLNANYSAAAYTYSGDVLDFFGRTDTGTLPVSREGLLDTVTLVRLVNIWNQHPITQSGMSLIALTARNRSVKKLSVLASGYVRDLPQGRGPLITNTDGNDTYTKVLLHMDGADAATTFTDSNAGGSAHTWTASGNAQIDTAQSKFGGASGLFDGTGDYIRTPDHADFALGSDDFTIDFWFNCTATTGSIEQLTGQCDSSATNASASFVMQRTAANIIRAYVSVGSTIFEVNGTTQFTNLLNTGWHHVAFVRTGDTLRLFIDGIQEGSDTTVTGSVNDSSNQLAVGAAGEVTTNPWTGWIDEFRLSAGVARWTASFTPPTVAYGESNVVKGFISFDAAGTSTADVDILALFRVPNQPDISSFESPKLALRGSGTSGAENWYQFGFKYVTAGLDSKDAVTLDRVLAGTTTTIATGLFPWAFDRNFFMRFRAEGTSLKGKAWSAALPEPDDWTVEITDANITAGGWIGVATPSASKDFTAQYNWFSVGLDGDVAPSPPSLVSTLATDFSEQTLDAELSGWTLRLGTITSFVSASGRFPYNGNQSDWTAFRTTSQPAAHFRDVLTGSLNYDPLPEELLDDDSLVNWWRRCALSDFTCDIVVEGLEVPDLLRVISSCGYGRLYRSELFGVIQDFDRSAETPVQIFSPRNSSGLSWKKAFARLPAGFRINFREEDLDYGSDQVVVYRRGTEGSSNRLEQVTYDGLVRVDDIIRRANFDLLQAERRAAFYTLNAPAESIVCRRGDLIGVTHDVLQSQYGYARIQDVIYDENEITGVILDAPIEVVTEEDVLAVYDMLEVENVLDLGVITGVAIRLTTGQTTTHALDTPTGLTDELSFSVPIAVRYGHTSPFDRHPIHTVAPGCLVVAGVLSREYKRLVVSEISPQTNLEAQLVCVDEASEMFGEVFGVAV